MQLQPDLYGGHAEAVRAIAATVPLVRADPEVMATVRLAYESAHDETLDQYSDVWWLLKERDLAKGAAQLREAGAVPDEKVECALFEAFLNALSGNQFPALARPWQAGVELVRAK